LNWDDLYVDSYCVFFIIDQYIGNMVKANVIFGMQEYLGVALTKCNVSTKIGNTPISVGIFTIIFMKEKKIQNVIINIFL